MEVIESAEKNTFSNESENSRSTTENSQNSDDLVIGQSILRTNSPLPSNSTDSNSDTSVTSCRTSADKDTERPDSSVSCEQLVDPVPEPVFKNFVQNAEILKSLSSLAHQKSSSSVTSKSIDLKFSNATSSSLIAEMEGDQNKVDNKNGYEENVDMEMVDNDTDDEKLMDTKIGDEEIVDKDIIEDQISYPIQRSHKKMSPTSLVTDITNLESADITDDDVISATGNESESETGNATDNESENSIHHSNSDVSNQSMRDLDNDVSNGVNKPVASDLDKIDDVTNTVTNTVTNDTTDYGANIVNNDINKDVTNKYTNDVSDVNKRAESSTTEVTSTISLSKKSLSTKPEFTRKPLAADVSLSNDPSSETSETISMSTNLSTKSLPEQDTTSPSKKMSSTKSFELSSKTSERISIDNLSTKSCQQKMSTKSLQSSELSDDTTLDVAPLDLSTLRNSDSATELDDTDSGSSRTISDVAEQNERTLSERTMSRTQILQNELKVRVITSHSIFADFSFFADKIRGMNPFQSPC